MAEAQDPAVAGIEPHRRDGGQPDEEDDDRPLDRRADRGIAQREHNHDRHQDKQGRNEMCFWCGQTHLNHSRISNQ
jgi:hypothetical protein